GTNASAFAQNHTCGASLAAGASCTISLTFKPAATGPAAATLTVADSATGSPQSAALTGFGVTSTVSLSPTSLTFANQTVGTTSATQFSTLTNSGTTTITISGETISGDFAFAGLGTCGTSLAPGTSCTTSVTFKPTATGTRAASVAVTDNAAGSPQTAGLSASGVSSGTSGTDFYVSTAGSNSSGNGSSSSPWATIAYASTKVGPGSTVHVAPGTYSGQFNTDASGTSSAYITYVSDTKWGAKIAGGSSSTWSNHGAYVTIQGFDVTGPTGCCEGLHLGEQHQDHRQQRPQCPELERVQLHRGGGHRHGSRQCPDHRQLRARQRPLPHSLQQYSRHLHRQLGHLTRQRQLRRQQHFVPKFRLGDSALA